MLRHGILRSPIHWEEIKEDGFEGLWIIANPSQQPDVIIYYAHGGGFSMGSSYFYLEFLLAFFTLVKAKMRYANPAILALEYSLVPDASHPMQLHQAMAGYEYILSIIKDPSRIVVSGDSAGGTIILSLLLHLGQEGKIGKLDTQGAKALRLQGLTDVRPGMAVLISPWTTLSSPLHRNTRSDYLDSEQLNHYAHQYCGDAISPHDPVISPGECQDMTWWSRAAPREGFFITYGAEEVFAPEIENLLTKLETTQVCVRSHREEGGIHAWPVASLFLSNTRQRRMRGLEELVDQIRERIDKKSSINEKP